MGRYCVLRAPLTPHHHCPCILPGRCRVVGSMFLFLFNILHLSTGVQTLMKSHGLFPGSSGKALRHSLKPATALDAVLAGVSRSTLPHGSECHVSCCYMQPGRPSTSSALFCPSAGPTGGQAPGPATVRCGRRAPERANEHAGAGHDQGRRPGGGDLRLRHGDVPPGELYGSCPLPPHPLGARA
jgi:hypothetical protein